MTLPNIILLTLAISVQGNMYFGAWMVAFFNLLNEVRAGNAPLVGNIMKMWLTIMPTLLTTHTFERLEKAMPFVTFI
jgi:hypothetical protein